MRSALKEAEVIRFDVQDLRREKPGEAFGLVAHSQQTIRWPEGLRIDRLPVPGQVSDEGTPQIREMYIATPIRGLMQKDNGRAGALYHGHALFDQLFGVLKRSTYAAGLVLKKDRPTIQGLAIASQRPLVPAGLQHPLDPTLRGFRLPHRAGGRKWEAYLAKHYVYWFAPDSPTLVGYTPLFTATDDTVRWVRLEVEPELPASFFKFERKCGDWSH